MTYLIKLRLYRIVSLLYSASDVNVSFEDVLNHVKKYLLACFLFKRNLKAVNVKIVSVH